jgi:hypothetical protein
MEGKTKKNTNLAQLLGEDSTGIEQKITGLEKKAPTQDSLVITQSEPLTELKHLLEDERGLPKSFTKAFQKNARYDKEARTTTIVYTEILRQYKNLAAKMEIDTVVLLNNVLAEWHNKHLDSIDKVLNRRSNVKAL